MEYRLNFHAGKLALAALDKWQTQILETILAPASQGVPAHALIYGRPGAGRTNLAIHLARELFAATGGEIVFLVPDRLRADRLQSTVEAALPTLVRPVKTPTALAYQYLSSWFVERAQPLLPPQLLTGAREDRELADLLAQAPLSWPAEVPATLLAVPAFRMEIRNLFERSREMGLGGADLISLGRQYQVPIWETGGELLKLWEQLPFNQSTATEPAYLSAAQMQETAAQVIHSWESEAAGQQVHASFKAPYAVIVDDLQDCTLATLRLLQALAGAGTRVIATANPDVAVATYRGGEPHLDGRFKETLAPQVFELGPTHRGNQRNAQLLDALAANLSVAGGVKRRALGAADPSEDLQRLQTASFSSVHQENAAIIKTINHHHLRHQLPLTEIAVVVRNSADVERIRQALVRAGIPATVNSRAIAYAAEPLTAMLLRLLSSENTVEKTLLTEAGESVILDEELEILEQLVRSPLVQFDPLKLRRVADLVGQLAQRELNLRELFALVSDLTAPASATTSAEFRRVQAALLDPDYAQIIEEIQQATQLISLGRSLQNSEPPVAIWELWKAAGLEAKLAKTALSAAPEAASADDRLDAVISLSRTADVWQQRHVGQTAQAFADEQLSQKLPSDNLAAIAQRPAGVEVLTVMQAAGRQWPVVIVAGVQADKWPNLAVRNRLTRAGEVTFRVNHPELAALKAGELNWQLKMQARIDEMRTFVCAVSRTLKHLYVYAVSNENEVPSVFFELVNDFIRSAGAAEKQAENPAENPAEHPSETAVEDGAEALSESAGAAAVAAIPEADLRPLVAKMRKLSASLPLYSENLTPQQQALTETAERLLAFLAAHGIRVANPLNWTGIQLEKIDAQPIFAGGKPVLSPSAIESLLTCPAQWFLARHGGRSKTAGAASLGNLVHKIAEIHPRGTASELLAELETLWDDGQFNRGTELGRRAYEDVQEKLWKLAEYFKDLGKVHVEVEKAVRVDVGPAIIAGFIDRLEHTPDGVMISDIKTGTVPGVKLMDTHKQLAFYQYALMRAGYLVQGARLIALKEKDPKRYLQSPIMGTSAASQELLSNTKADLATAVKRAAGPFYEPIAGKHCDHCEVKASCPLLDEGLRTIE